EGEGLVEPAGIGQDPGCCASKPRGMSAQLDVGLVDHRREGALAEKGDRTGGIAPHLGFQARTRLPEFLRRHVSRPPRWSVDDSGETSSIVEQTPLLMRLRADIGKTGEMQHRPEAIAAAREVMTGGRGGGGRVERDATTSRRECTIL